MKRPVKRLLTVVLLLSGAALAAAGWLAAKALPIGTGYAAKYLCTSVFVSGRDAQTVFEEDVRPVNPLAAVVAYRVDRPGAAVHADAFGLFASTAVYREGGGCTLAAGGVSAAALRGQTPAARGIREAALDDLPWPQAAVEVAADLPPGVDPARLKQLLDAAFAEERPEAPRRTRAVVVVHDGRIVAERYAPGFHPRMPLIGWSMAKSVTSALVGVLVRQGRLDPQRPAPVPEWQAAGDPRREITLDQLLRMESGLAFDEIYLPLTDATEMLYGSADFAAAAAAKPLAGPPGSVWNYSSGAANIVARIVRQTVERDAPGGVADFMRRELFDKLGMASALIEPDPSGTFVGSSYAVATPRDWARFGLLYLWDGVWRGERILPEGWVRYTTTPTPKAPKGEYGAMFWLNAGAPADPSVRLWPSAPPDAFAAQGFQEQKVIVIPSRKLVLVRFGATSERRAWDTDAFLAAALAAFPPP